MALPLDTSAITHGIQLAVAPVFLLTAVSGMIGAVAGRLARIIDRARVVEDKARASNDAELIQRTYAELATLRRHWQVRDQQGQPLLTLLIVPAGFSLADSIEKRLGRFFSRNLLTYRKGDDTRPHSAPAPEPAE